MGGTTDAPLGKRPRCPECDEHRWSWDGRCLSATCNPLSRNSDGSISIGSQTKSKKPVEKIVLPPWMRSKPKSPRQLKEALAYCEMKGIDPPWIDKNKEQR